MEIKFEIISSVITQDDLPKFETAGSAGVDLRAINISDCPEDTKIVLEPNEVRMIGTGLKVFIEDPNYVGFILPRSGMGHKRGLILGNTTGVIDSDYQGELKVSLWNRGTEPQVIAQHDRIAQLVILPVARPTYVQGTTTSDSERGSGGFGSTGTA